MRHEQLACTASITFEFETRAPVTHRIKTPLVAWEVQTIFTRAVMEAKAALKPIGWCSVVCVLERVATPDGAGETPRETD